MAKPVKMSHFWIGTIVTVLSVAIGTVVEIRKTNSEIESSQKENRRVHASTLLKDISSSVNGVAAQLRSHADMYFEIEQCLSKPNAQRKACWSQKHPFDPVEAQQAWDILEMNINATSPFLEGNEEIKLLEKLRTIRTAHQKKLRPMLPPKSANEAQAVRSVILATRNELISITYELQRTVALTARKAYER